MTRAMMKLGTSAWIASVANECRSAYGVLEPFPRSNLSQRHRRASAVLAVFAAQVPAFAQR
jgi:hypothetical protein